MERSSASSSTGNPAAASFADVLQTLESPGVETGENQHKKARTDDDEVTMASDKDDPPVSPLPAAVLPQMSPEEMQKKFLEFMQQSSAQPGGAASSGGNDMSVINMMLPMFQAMMTMMQQQMLQNAQNASPKEVIIRPHDKVLVDPEADALIKKAIHKHADALHKFVKHQRRQKQLDQQLQTLETGRLPEGNKEPKVLQELSSMTEVFPDAENDDVAVNMIIPRGSTRNEAIAALNLQHETWKTRIMLSAQSAHTVTLKESSTKAKFGQRLEAAIEDESLKAKTVAAGLDDAKSKYTDNSVVITKKFDEYWGKVVQEVEDRLQKEEKSKLNKLKSQKSNKDNLANDEPEPQFTAQVTRIVHDIVGEVPQSSPGGALGQQSKTQKKKDKKKGKGADKDDGKGKGAKGKSGKGKGKEPKWKNNQQHWKNAWKAHSKSKGKGKGQENPKGKSKGQH